LARNLFDILSYAIDKGFLVNVSTNGTLVDDDYIRFVADKKIGTRISLHTLDPVKFADIAKRDDLDQVTAAVDRLRDGHSYYSLTATVYDKNVDDIPSLGQYALDNVANSIRFTPVYPCNLGKQWAATGPLILRMIHDIASLAITMYDDLEVTCEHATETIVDIMTTRRCVADEDRFSIITAGGSNRACPFYPNAEELATVQGIIDSAAVCKTCDYAPVCQGGCKALNNWEQGTSDFLCMREIVHAAIEDFTPEEKQKLYRYWQGLYAEYSYAEDFRLGCVRKLPIWELVFNRAAVRRARYGG